MPRKHVIRPLIDALKPKRRPGAIAKVTACPYCGFHMSQTDHAAHRTACKQQFLNAPPQQADVQDNPLPPAEFDQDSGGGYNADHTFPQT